MMEVADRAVVGMGVVEMEETNLRIHHRFQKIQNSLLHLNGNGEEMGKLVQEMALGITLVQMSLYMMIELMTRVSHRM
jgi:hypothetical protein